MATLTPFHDTRYASKDNIFPVLVRVQHEGKRKYIPTGYKVSEAQFKDGRVIKHSQAPTINAKISSIIAEAEKYLADCSVHGRMVRLELIGTGKTSRSFIDYLSHRAVQYQSKGQIVMHKKISRLAKEIRDCFKADMTFDDITPDALRIYESWLKGNSNGDNTRQKKFKQLGELFAAAIEEKLTDASNPFKKHHIPIKPVSKDKLSIEEIQRIEELDLQPGLINDFRNLFLFSYYTKGSRFENCVTLLRKQIKGDRVHVKMNKGNKFISVKIHERLAKILKQYKGKELVFPFLKELPTDNEEYLSKISSKNTQANKALKTIAVLADIKIPLTMHIARHTFANHLKQVTNNINIIQESLGHSDQRVTQLYLKTLGDERLDVEMEKLYGR